MVYFTSHCYWPPWKLLRFLPGMIRVLPHTSSYDLKGERDTEKEWWREKEKKYQQTSKWFCYVREPTVTGVLPAFHRELVQGSGPSKRNLGAQRQTQTTQQHHAQEKLTLREHCWVGSCLMLCYIVTKNISLGFLQNMLCTHSDPR